LTIRKIAKAKITKLKVVVMKLPKDKTGTPALRPANDDSYRQIHHTPFDGEFLEFFEH
jgi:hypothetical protein